MFVSQRNSCAFSKRVILIVICIIVLNFVQETSQFTFNFGGKDAEDELPSVSTNSKLAKKGRAVGKYKFRKIERVYTDDENLVDGDSEAANSKQAKEDDDDDSKAQSAEADNSRMNEDEEATFEKARKAHKKLPTTKKVTKPRKKARKYTEDDEDDDNQPAEAETSMFHAIYDMFFGAKEEVATTEDEDKNSIITWLKWLAEKTARQEEDEDSTSKEKDDSASWKDYLNRWPFNSLFPMEKPKKSNRAAKKTAPEHVDRSEEAQPMSQEQFESLLHTLPAFVLSPSNVDDIDCRRQLQIFQRQLRGNKMWTLQSMFY